MSRESVWNVQRYCGLSEHTIRRAICQHHGHKYLGIHTEKLVEIYTSHLDETCHHMHTYIASRRDMCYHMYIHFEIHIIMHKRVYTVTLDIECWDDLKVEKIDWAKKINLFPDEFIHSSVQERTSPRPVDRA